jgi:glycosyltransferase involved in cell wall biosynthesis
MAHRALVLVRNDVLHDARVLRAARVLADSGWDPLIAGVVTERTRDVQELVAGVPVVRLTPGVRRGGPEAPPRAVGKTAPRIPTPPPARRSATARFKRLLVTLDYYRRGIALVRTERPRLVHANDYNTMWIAVAAKILCGSTVVYDTHELWADRNGRPEWRPWLVACEALFVRVADAVITTSPGYADELSRRYRIATPKLVRNIPEQVAMAQAPGREERPPPVAAYVGGLLRGRGLEQAIDALAELPELRLRLIGPGALGYVEELRRRATSAGVVERVGFEGAAPPEGVVDALSGARVGLMLIQPVCLSYELTLPNKLFEYAAAGVPILSSDLPVMAETVRGGDLGEVVPPSDPAAIAAGIGRLLDPERAAVCRAALASFVAANTWAEERELLERAYADAETKTAPRIEK